jgi:hypothetical protein
MANPCHTPMLHSDTNLLTLGLIQINKTQLYLIGSNDALRVAIPGRSRDDRLQGVEWCGLGLGSGPYGKGYPRTDECFMRAVWGAARPQGGRPAAVFFPLGYPFPYGPGPRIHYPNSVPFLTHFVSHCLSPSGTFRVTLYGRRSAAHREFVTKKHQ